MATKGDNRILILKNNVISSQLFRGVSVIVTFLRALLVISTPSKKKKKKKKKCTCTCACVCVCLPACGSIGANTYLVCLIVTLYVMPQSFLQNGPALYCMFPNFGKLVLLSVHCRLTYSRFWTFLPE